MKQARPKHLGLIVAIMVLGGAMALLAGCTMVGDSLTGVSLETNGPTGCVKQCNDLYKQLYEDEQKLHQQNVEACQLLPGGDVKANCLAAEDARHQAAKAALSAGKTECQNSCHRQGTGSAG